MNLDNLVLEAKKGNNEAFEEILKSFKGYIYKITRETFINGYDTEDLMQIGYMTLVKAISKYDPSNNRNFLPYAISAIKNNFYYEIRQKSKYNAESSLNIVINDGFEIMDTLMSEENIEQDLITKEATASLYKALSKLLPEEKELIYHIYFNKNKLAKFAKDKNLKYSDCTKMKVRTLKKLRNFLNSNNNHR